MVSMHVTCSVKTWTQRQKKVREQVKPPLHLMIHYSNLQLSKRQCSKKQRHHFADTSQHSQSYGFSSSHVQTWELNHKEGWAPTNWCFWSVVLEKILESPLDSKEIKPVNPKGNQPWIVNRRTDLEAPILWPLDAKSRLIGKDPDAGKDWGQDGIIDSMDHESEPTLGESGRQRSLECYSIWGHKKSDMT